MDSTSRRHLLVLGGAALLLLAARLLIAHSLALIPDEALYAWEAARAPYAFSPQPPGIALLVGAGMALLGKTELGVRLFSVLFSTATLLPVYFLARALGGPAVAFFATLAAALVPGFAAFGVLATPDAPQLFFWSLALLLTWRALNSSRLADWVLAGLVVGISLYVKYVLVLYFPSLLLCLLLTPQGRAQLRTAGPYLAALVALVVFVPVFAWQQYPAGWEALRYHLSERHAPGFSFHGLSLYLLIHAVFFSPLLYVLALVAVGAAGRLALKTNDHRAAFLFSFSVVSLVLFALLGALTERQHFREHWDAPAYVPAIIAAGIWLEGRSARRLGAATLALAALTTAFVGVELNATFASRVIGAPSFFSNVLGWRQMADQADQALAQLPPGSFFLGISFTETLEHAFYSRRPVPLYTLDHSAHYKYGLGPLLDATGVSSVHLAREDGGDSLFVTAETNGIHENALRQIFSQVEELPPVEISAGGRVLKRFRLFRCLSFDHRAFDTLIFFHGGPAGGIDLAEVRGNVLVIEGWAADEKHGAPVARVEVFLDDRSVGDANLGLLRPDVRNSTGRDDFLPSGWQVLLDVRRLPPGEHRVTAVAYDRAGTARRLSIPRTVIVAQ
ncbi:MAG TPA: glycosyltransferase family 39 protein [Candidatus Xenobia bacterium]|nr:glycosyltransferase family 39 protein [Candidatus Xenobia bacterium]